MRPVARSAVFSLLVSAMASGCAHGPWPDEPGIPVELVRAENVNAGDLFLETLTNRRRAANLSAPIVAPRYQAEIQRFAEELQAGKVTVTDAERAIGRWARAAYRRDARTFALDCSAGTNMPMPAALVELQFVVISYAAAHFRPRSVPKGQCAILLTALVGSEQVERIEQP